MVDVIRSRFVVLFVALLMAFAAFGASAQTAHAHGNTHYAIAYSAWLAECYYGGYSWYDYYAHGGYYYWDWC